MDRTHPDPVRRLAWRLLATALVAVAAWGSFAEYTQWRRVQGDLAATAERTGLLEQQPDLLRDLRRYVHPEQARVRLGLALLAQELDRRWLEPLTPEEREEQLQLGFERLDAAGELAADVLARQPGSWDASLVLGGSRFLSFSRRNDPRLRSRPELSEGLMLRARQLAPGRPEPARLLSAFYLSNWSRLPQSQRAQAMGILAAALENPTSFDLLIGPWLRVAPSLETALAVVPDDPRHWGRLQQVFTRRGDVERVRDVTARLKEVFPEFAEKKIEEAERQLRLGATRQGRQGLLWVLAHLDPEVAHVPLFERLLSALPPGPIGKRQADQLRWWLDWAADLCLYSACAVEREALERAARLVEGLPPGRRALAALAGDDLVGAEEIERRAASTSGDEWAPYWILKARSLAARGRPADAGAAIARVPGSWRASAPALKTELAIAAAANDAVALGRARAALTAAEAVSWPPEAWQRTDRSFQLALLPARMGHLRLEPDVAGDGAVIGLLLDGSAQGVYSLLPGESWESAQPVLEGGHLLELRVLMGRLQRPGAARLTAAP